MGGVKRNGGVDNRQIVHDCRKMYIDMPGSRSSFFWNVRDPKILICAWETELAPFPPFLRYFPANYHKELHSGPPVPPRKTLRIFLIRRSSELIHFKISNTQKLCMARWKSGFSKFMQTHFLASFSSEDGVVYFFQKMASFHPDMNTFALSCIRTYILCHLMQSQQNDFPTLFHRISNMLQINLWKFQNAPCSAARGWKQFETMNFFNDSRVKQIYFYSKYTG